MIISFSVDIRQANSGSGLYCRKNIKGQVKKMERIEAKKLVVKAGLELVDSGLIARTWGNVSCRVDEETFVITPSGREYQSLTAADIVEVKISDLSWSGEIKPSSEKGIHAAVYQLHPEMNFVIHTHQENASAASAADPDSFTPAPGFPSLGNAVVSAKYALPGTKSLIRNVEAALRISKGCALLLKHHGTLCFGKSYEETFETARQLEAACGVFINEHGGMIHTEKQENRTELPSEAEALLSAWNVSGNKGRILINTDPDVVRFAKHGRVLKPLLDDFAQIVGTKVKTVGSDSKEVFRALGHVSAVMVRDLGAVCWGPNESDAEAASMIVRKNCKAYFAAYAFGHPNYIKPWECILMRNVYLKKYSRMTVKNKAGGQ
jgi:L-fuculose-phosphate aldolase